MFQFTREFIINDNEGKIGGKKFGLSADKKTLYVDNMINIRRQDVNAIYKHAYEPAVDEVAKFTVTAPVAADANKVYRLVITLGQEGKVTATYNDYYPDHSRQFFYETVATSTSATDIIDGLVASYKHEATLSDVKFFDLAKDGSDLKISAPDCYTRIKEVRLVKLPQPVGQVHVGAVLTGYEDYEVVFDWKRTDGATGACTSLVKGKEGNGNTVQILKNMRLQTDAHLYPHGLQMDERPLPKGKYDQYTVELVTERRHIGHDVMGSVGTSLTTLVFYVLTSATCADQAISADFAEALEELWQKAPLVAVEEKEVKQVLAHTNQLPDPEEGGSSASN